MVNTLSYFDSNKNTCINSKSPLNITLNVVLRQVIISMLKKKKTQLFFCFKFSERFFFGEWMLMIFSNAFDDSIEIII